MIRGAWEILLDILFPPICLVCEAPLEESEKLRFLCDDCFAKVQFHTSLISPICGSRLAENKKICHKAVQFRLAAATTYSNEITKHLIWMLKYSRKTVAARPLADFVAIYFRTLPIRDKEYAILPLPLYAARERTRGFNQSERIAHYLGLELKLPVYENILVKIRDTAPQAETKNRDERLRNVQNSFAVRNNEQIFKKDILLIDDVFTSGSTAREAVRTLREAGSGSVTVLVVAKA